MLQIRSYLSYIVEYMQEYGHVKHNEASKVILCTMEAKRRKSIPLLGRLTIDILDLR